MKSFLQALAVVGTFNAICVYLYFSYRSTEKIDQEVAHETVFGGKENLDVVANAQHISIFKLDSRLIYELSPEEIEELGIPNAYGYPIVQGPKDTEPILADILREDFSNPNLFTHSIGVNLCIFEPDYLIRFTKDSSEIDLLISLAHCPEFRVYSDGKKLEYEEIEIGEGHYARKVYPGFGHFAQDPKRVHHALEYFFPLWGGKELDANRVARGINSPSPHTTTHTDP